MWIVEDALDKGHGGDKGHSVFCQGLGKPIDLSASPCLLMQQTFIVHFLYKIPNSKSLKVALGHYGHQDYG